MSNQRLGTPSATVGSLPCKTVSDRLSNVRLQLLAIERLGESLRCLDGANLSGSTDEIGEVIRTLAAHALEDAFWISRIDTPHLRALAPTADERDDPRFSRAEARR